MLFRSIETAWWAKVGCGSGPWGCWMLGILLACILFQLAVYAGVFWPLLRAMQNAAKEAPGLRPKAEPEPMTQPGDDPAWSVVICARNEKANLMRNLPLILGQDHPSFEVIVVDDGSTDGSATWLAEQATSEPRLRIVSLTAGEKSMPGKKEPLSLGIRAARAPWLALTDADCRPASALWLAALDAATSDDRDFVLGYGAYERYPGWLNRVVQFETLHAAWQYLGWAQAGMPYMGVGRNLAYRKSVWEEQGGFAAHVDWPSGDDDLFVNAAAKNGRVACALHPNAFTVSQPPQTWRDWFQQKFRHFSTGGSYRPMHRWVLGAYAMSHFGTYAAFFAGIGLGASMPWLLGLFILRWVLQLVLYRGLMRSFSCPELWYFSTILDAGTVAYYATFVSAVMAPKPITWR